MGLTFVACSRIRHITDLSSRLSDRQKEDARLLQLMSCFSKGNTESDGDCGVFTCRAEPYTCPFKYHHVVADWQRTCRSLGLGYCGSIALGGSDICLTSPLTLRPITGDGNCLFRAFSFIITGEVEQHMVI